MNLLLALVSMYAFAGQTACVSQKAIEDYTKSKAVVNMTERPPKILASRKGDKSHGYSLRFVRMNLQNNKLVGQPSTAEEQDAMDDDDSGSTTASPQKADRPNKSKLAGPWLEAEGFVNLLDCPTWKNKLSTGGAVPKGAVVLYSEGPNGHAEIKTTAGFWSDNPRASQDFAPHQKVLGVYIKPVL